MKRKVLRAALALGAVAAASGCSAGEYVSWLNFHGENIVLCEEFTDSPCHVEPGQRLFMVISKGADFDREWATDFCAWMGSKTVSVHDDNEVVCEDVDF